jgi:hypothetical protein
MSIETELREKLRKIAVCRRRYRIAGSAAISAFSQSRK